MYPIDILFNPLLSSEALFRHKEIELDFHENSKIRKYWFEPNRKFSEQQIGLAEEHDNAKAMLALSSVTSIMTKPSWQSTLVPPFSYCVLVGRDEGGYGSYWLEDETSKAALIQTYPGLPNLSLVMMPRYLASRTTGLVSIILRADLLQGKHGAARYRQALVLAGYTACDLINRGAQRGLRLIRPDLIVEDILSITLGLDTSLWWVLETVIALG